MLYSAQLPKRLRIRTISPASAHCKRRYRELIAFALPAGPAR